MCELEVSMDYIVNFISSISLIEEIVIDMLKWIGKSLKVFNFI